ncbi:M14 family zinc carboxypeptidase [Cytobacillus solani]|uniref:Peptidase M14 n=1 Tax=Cytobacillus solani TaxID=1637975 RepID=A0A0Q3QK32_9BACI|nr:M14 family zinc carboxypeptidase [Cytobacillus solani]KOP81235.1 peptidase M14 [Bacillus sp. FJAT-21945]KQL18249.1 peptidase M14 [Cytobacillus solani]USK56090.1 peptidase M14 [Cytobacillus solani]
MNKLWKVLSSTALAASLLAAPNVGFAEPGPSPQQGENLSIEGFISYEELGRKLEQIQKSSQGKVKVESAGKTNLGRDIYKVTVGHGDKVVLIESEIHGNEKTGTVALLNILQNLGSSNSKEAKKILDELTIVVIPMMNADGSELDRRANDMDWAEVVAKFPQLANVQPSWNYYNYPGSYNYDLNPGFDVNRDFNPDLNYVPKPEDFPGASNKYGWYITPEAQTLRDVYKDLKEQFGKVDVFIDLHHQGFPYVEGTDDRVTMSISGKFVKHPNSPGGEKYAEYAENYNYDFSRQLNLALYNALQEKGNSVFTNISLYDQTIDLPGTALGAFALNGSGAVLFEVSGQTQNFGQKKRGQLVKTVETGLMGIINSVTDRSIYQLNPEEYENIPLSVRTPGGL